MICATVVAMTRTAATADLAVRDRVLGATVRCLSENGYAATTTRRVAEIAGVSQGALQHYFPSKGSLVEAAMDLVMTQLLEDTVARSSSGGSEDDRAEALIDLIWEIHTRPITPAVLELFNVARTDAKLARCVADVVTVGMGAITAIAQEALPTYAVRPGFADFVQIAMATVRGTVIVAAIPGAEGAHPSWPTVRAHLLESLRRL